MSSRLTVRLPEDLSRALASASARQQRTRSEIVRLALIQFLKLPPLDGETPAARVQHLIGSLESGIPDLAENHRDQQAPPGLEELVRRGMARGVVRNDPTRYRRYERALSDTTAQELLDWDRGDR